MSRTYDTSCVRLQSRECRWKSGTSKAYSIEAHGDQEIIEKMQDLSMSSDLKQRDRDVACRNL